jgi:hypothetical protein
MSSRAIRGPLRFDTYKILTAAGGYTVVNESLIVVNKTVGAATTITLPPSGAVPNTTGQIRVVQIVDGKGDANSNNITIAAAGTDTINGGATVVGVSAAFGVCFCYDQGGGVWTTGPGPTSGAATFSTITLTGLLTESAGDSLTAVGTNQGTALALTKEVNRITTGASTTGVTLPLASAGLDILVINSVANSIHVYGGGTDTINDVATATGIIQPANSIVLYCCTTSAPAGKYYAEGIGGGYSGSLATYLTVGGISAAGVVQGTATLLTGMQNRVTTCAAGAGVLLPANVAGMSIEVTNDGANALLIYPDSGAAINGLPTNTATSLPVGQSAAFTCVATNVWKTPVIPPREAASTLTTNGAGTILAATIVGGEVTRSGNTGAVSDTTDTAVAIIAATHGAAVGQAWEFTYVNSTAFTVTLIGGAGNTVTMLGGSAVLAVPPNSWARFLVTIATGTTTTMQCLAQGPNGVLPYAKFSTINVTTGTLAAGNASGAAMVYLQSTNATPGSQAMRTVAQILADTPGLTVGMSYMLRVTNQGAGSFTLATDSGTQWTLTGTSFVVAQNTFKDFVLTVNSATTGTIQAVGYGTFS